MRSLWRCSTSSQSCRPRYHSIDCPLHLQPLNPHHFAGWEPTCSPGLMNPHPLWTHCVAMHYYCCRQSENHSVPALRQKVESYFRNIYRVLLNYMSLNSSEKKKTLTAAECISRGSILPISWALRSSWSVIKPGFKWPCKGLLLCCTDVVVLWASVLGSQEVSDGVGFKPWPRRLRFSRTATGPAVVPL